MWDYGEADWGSHRLGNHSKRENTRSKQRLDVLCRLVTTDRTSWRVEPEAQLADSRLAGLAPVDDVDI